MQFESNVFINCPFDAEYDTLLKPLIYTIIHLGFEPLLSQTTSSAVTRIEQIKKLIKESRFSIHDLSRCKPLKKKDLPRFNMPFELGLDIGCFEYGSGRLKSKKMLILETERYHYQKILSDIAGHDIENHNDEPLTLVGKIRNWFSIIDEKKEYPQGIDIYNDYSDFIDKAIKPLPTKLTDIPIAEYIKFAKKWIANPGKSNPVC